MANLSILVVGSRGREQALAWRLSQSPLVSRIFVAPGNGGSEFGSKCTNVAISVSDFPKLVDFAKSYDVHIVIPGPEQPLVDGIEAHFRKGVSTIATRDTDPAALHRAQSGYLYSGRVPWRLEWKALRRFPKISCDVMTCQLPHII